MKYLPQFAVFISLLLVLVVLTSLKKENAIPPLNGAWNTTDGRVEQLLIVADGYCMLTRFDKNNKKFGYTTGGSFTVENKQIVLKTEFNSADKSVVGKTQRLDYNISGNTLTTSIGGTQLKYTRTDDGKSELSGNWRIVQRRQDDKMVDIPLRARRTLKLLSGNHFQWAAINVETGEFSGTGGGKYTFENGKYTEYIEFFSRDDSRVGASLSFDGKLEDGNWIHSGLSSKGDPIYEIWARFKYGLGI
ncbi:MAG: hypothetical protein KF862_05820 [Chitinophagaceae bacterium]|nr:hypothetical protein [Chitinophagaceae bacterium]